MPCGCGKTREKRAAARVERNAQRASASPPTTRYTVTDAQGNVQPYPSYIEARRAAKAIGGDLRPAD